MSEMFVKVLLSLSLSGTLLMLLVFLLKRLLQNKLSRSWQYYIWLIVALRFLLPIAPAGTAMNYLFERADAAIVTENTIQEPTFTAAELSPVNMPAAQSSTASEPVSLSAGFSVYTIIVLVWLAVTLMLITRKITIYQCFTEYIRAGRREIDDIDTLNLLADRCEKLHVRRPVQLYQNPLIGSPMMIGFVRPAIVLPAESLTSQELSYIFTHELHHYKRRDLFYKWFIQFVICAHWFNPFVYLLGKEINRACELSCDEAVISSLDKSAKKSYGDTLISALKAEHSYQNSLASVTLTEGAEQIKERLGAIMKFSKKGKVITMVTIALTVVLCICAIGIGAYTASAPSPESEFGIVSKKVKVPDVVLEAAIDWVEMEYTYQNDLAEQEGPYTGYTNWKIDSLEQVYTYEDWNGMTLQVYLLNRLFLAEDPENAFLVGGMSIDDEGWVVPGYANSNYIIFRQEGTTLSYLTSMMENDCHPGDDTFTSDLQRWLDTDAGR